MGKLSKEVFDKKFILMIEYSPSATSRHYEGCGRFENADLRGGWEFIWFIKPNCPYKHQFWLTLRVCLLANSQQV